MINKDRRTSLELTAKKQQEIIVFNRIVKLVNSHNFENIDGFLSKNPNYEMFIKNSKLDGVIKHFGNPLSDEDYKNIIIKLQNNDTIVNNNEVSKQYVKSINNTYYNN